MKPSPLLVRQLPGLEKLVQDEENSEALGIDFAPELPPRRRKAREETPELHKAIAAERDNLLDAGRRALDKIENDGFDADLLPDEHDGAEAIVLLQGRPAILVQEGRFFPPPANWSVLEGARAAIEDNLKRVGRIEVTGHPEFEWLGTGFLVAPDVIMTNRHVAKEFCERARSRWSFGAGMTAHIDYVEEFGAVEGSEYEFTKVIGVHDTIDMALFKVELKSTTGAAAPAPLAIASKPPATADGHQVYTVGYPAWDGRRNDPGWMRKIFSDIFDVKRLQPGEIMRLLDGAPQFLHDCSTLGGNSGSAVFDLETHQVIGLHFQGRYLEGNWAVALWQIMGDPLIKKAKLNFV